MLFLLKKALFEFPVLRIDVCIPKWLQSFPETNKMMVELLCAVKKTAKDIKKMRDCFAFENLFEEDCPFINPDEIQMDLGKGKVTLSIGAKEGLFYRALSEESGEKIEDDLQLMEYVRALAYVRKEYDKVKDALTEAETHGYGVVYPSEDNFDLEKPQLIKKGAGYGVQFKANATSYHILRVDVTGSVSPIIGTKQQGEDFVQDTLKTYNEGEEKVWETNIFGKSLRSLVGDELSGKAGGMPLELRKKICKTMSKIVNDKKNNVICIVF